MTSVVPQMQQVFRRQQNGVFRRVWWAQDGTPPHRTPAVKDRLTELFGERVVANLEWLQLLLTWNGLQGPQTLLPVNISVRLPQRQGFFHSTSYPPCLKTTNHRHCEPLEPGPSDDPKSCPRHDSTLSNLH